MQECIQALSGACSDVAQGFADISLSYHFSLNVSFPTLQVFFFFTSEVKRRSNRVCKGVGKYEERERKGGVQEYGDVESD